MGIARSFEISASGMDVERQRLELAALNLANAGTTRTANGSPFHRQVLVARARQASELTPWGLAASAGAGSGAEMSVGGGAGMPALGSSGIPGMSALTTMSGLASQCGLGAADFGGMGMPGLSGGLGLPGGPGLAPEIGGGVAVAGVVDDPSPPRRQYIPGHPDAGPDGFVTLPNVEPVEEMVHVMAAARAFEANAAAFSAAREMATRALDMAR